MENSFKLIGDNLNQFLGNTAFLNLTPGHIIMILLGLAFIYFAITRELNPLLLVPVGFGIILGNIPFASGFLLGIFEDGSVMNYLYLGVLKSIYPSLIFLGIGAMTDFSSLIANPKLILIGIAAQLGIFGAFSIAMLFGFSPAHAGAISIIGGGDGITAIFLSAKLAPELISIVAISAFIYMALIPWIQPPIMRLLTTKKERVIKMKPMRVVSKLEKVFFPIIGILLTGFIVPTALPLLGMLFFGNLLKESGVTKKLADTVKGPLIDVVTILIGLTIGASAEAATFLSGTALTIFVLGAFSFLIATIGGVIFVKFMNLFLKDANKINPLIGNAGVAAFPDSARISQTVGMKYDETNFLSMHAMGPNLEGIIGSALAAGIMLTFLY
ncbi:MAG: sodium ion-translocating decarboxylase subunit beta [Bacteroidota bacterium]|nr:sodium ion-translocating decarboxylase subunit beta [Bacteroidota bacterium]